MAFRYLLGKKSSQAIHWITGISVVGIAVGTAALVLVLSVFNGFDTLVAGMFSKHNPDVKIIAAKTKYFTEEETMLRKLSDLDFVESLSRCYEEVCMFQYNDAQEFGIIKGVDSSFRSVSLLDEATVEGEFQTRLGNKPFANIGSGLRNKLGASVRDFQEPLRVFLPGSQEGGILQTNYQDFLLNLKSVFSFHQETDYNTVITDLEYLRKQKDSSRILSSLDLKLKERPTGAMLHEIQRIAGPDLLVKDRYLQDEAFLKIMRLEKWLYYALFCLTLVLVSFTVVGALWMIVLDKRFDIGILKSMGMEDGSIKGVFVLLAWMICCSGLSIGFLLAIGFYWVQSNFGIIGIPSDYLIDSYPMELRFFDFALVTITVLGIGWLAAFMPNRKVTEIKPIFHEE